MDTIFCCWINVILESYQDRIIAALVKKGYTVGPASLTSEIVASNKLLSKDLPAYMIALHVSKISDKNLTTHTVFDDISNILVDEKIYCYGVVITKSALDANWCGSNFDLTLKKTTKDSNLN